MEMIADKPSVLSKIDIFSECSEQDLEPLERRASTRTYQKGAIIVDDTGGHHVSWSAIDRAAGNAARERLKAHFEATRTAA